MFRNYIYTALGDHFTCGCTGPSSLGSPLFCSFLTRRACFTYPDLFEEIFSFPETIKTIQVQFLPETANENCADSHEEDHHQRHVEALLLVRRAAEKIISTSTLADVRGVELGTCTHRSSC